jgi:dihydroneopterin aldolase
MQNKITIALNNLRFFAFHGLYPEEQKTGNEFEVNLEVQYEVGDSFVLRLEDTVNYERLFEMVKNQMKEREDLLETVAMKIADTIYHEFPVVKEINIRVEKLHPPIRQFTGHVAVCFQKKY